MANLTFRDATPADIATIVGLSHAGDARGTDTPPLDPATLADPRYRAAFDEIAAEERVFDAIDAAQALATGDEEFGPVVALAAAPRAGRQDLIDRYRPLVMGNPHYQIAGIFPRLAMRVRANSVFEKLREGLVLAGVPPSALDGPFNADGTTAPPDRP